jgi:hypothetical protein
MYAASIVKSVIVGRSLPGVIPLELLGTDRIMQRWAVSNGSGLPKEYWDDRRKSKPPPLDSESALCVDGIVDRLPSQTKRVVVGWYCRPLPTSELAAELGMSQRGLEKSHIVTLYFLRFKFERTKSRGLLKLVRVLE